MPQDLNRIFKTLQKNIKAEFYPYTSIKHTIRKKNGIILIRVSDTFVDAPEKVLLCLGRILLAKLHKTPVMQKDRRIYNQYVTSEPLQKKASRMINRKRHTKIIKGRYKDLEKSFERVNNQYFNGSMEKPVLTWSVKRSKRTFGRYDVERDIVYISQVLDSPEIPEEFLDFIMYHELLHKKYGITIRKGKRRMHTPEFKREEKKFRNYEKMKLLMEKIART